MFIPSFMTFLVPLMLSPVWITHLYQLEFQDQRRQIWLDNASINLGRGDRLLFNQIEKTKKALDTLHHVYHSAQACRLIPQTTLFCGRLASRVKRTLALSLDTICKLSQLKWQANRLKAIKILEGKKYQGKWVGPEKIPLMKTKCEVCQEAFVLRIKTERVSTSLSLHKELTSPNILTLQTDRQGLWNYQIH